MIVVVVDCWSSSSSVPVALKLPGVALSTAVRFRLKFSSSSNTVSPLIVTWMSTPVSTFLIVTHDQRLADRCDRIIELVDGQILPDPANARAT